MSTLDTGIWAGSNLSSDDPSEDVDREVDAHLGDPGMQSSKAEALPSAVRHIVIFAISASTLMTQVLLTRIFSATMLYHYAFAAISLTMLGMTAGAVIVLLKPERFGQGHKPSTYASLCAWYALALIIPSVLISTVENFASPTISSLLANLLVFFPAFLISGMLITLLLTRNSRDVGSMYASDLCGAAMGCLLVPLLLGPLGPITCMLLNGAVLAVNAALAARWSAGRLLPRCTLILASLTAFLCVGNHSLSVLGLRHLSLNYSKGRHLERDWEAWNSYSHVTISQVIPSGPVLMRDIAIDSGASTPMFYLADHHDLSSFGFLRQDASNGAYHLRPVSRVAVIGVGGGKDILSALVHGADSVLGVEMNRGIVRALTRDFADFSGHLHSHPKVRIVNDEARSFLERQRSSFDLIQVSMIDTWAATAAGSFALTENGLYTAEAWQAFLARLTPRGMLSFTRWYNRMNERGEFYRMLAIAREAFSQHGVADVRSHLAAISTNGTVTLLISKSTITSDEIASLRHFAGEHGFRVVLTPWEAADRTAEEITADEASYRRALKTLMFDASPTTDDRPYFFNMAKPGIALKQALMFEVFQDAQEATSFNYEAVMILLAVLVLVTLLSLLTILLPLWRSGLSLPRGGPTWGGLLFFFGIGLGYMFLEIALMQRLMIFLGHPAYALSAVLFALLLAGGLGSLSTRATPAGGGRWRLVMLCAVLVATGWLTGAITHQFRAADNPTRIAVAVALLLPPGFFMGMAFPLGLKRMALQDEVDLGPWMWGVNGAASVIASVVALALAIFEGITAAYWTGVACYLIATAVYLAKGITEPSRPAHDRHSANHALS